MTTDDAMHYQGTYPHDTGFWSLGRDAGGRPVRGSRVALAQTAEHADQLQAALKEHAGVVGEIVMRPLIGIALALPAFADTAEIAHALDCEQVTAGFLDFHGRACIAVPAEVEFCGQTAHAVAKVLHLVLEVHTDYINTVTDQSCPIPDYAPQLDDAAAMDAVIGVVTGATAVMEQLGRLHALPSSSELAPLLMDGLQMLSDAIDQFKAAQAAR